MNRRNSKLLFGFASILLCLSFSFPITFCWETKSKYNNSIKDFPDLTPLSVNDLKELLQKDTTHYKIVVIYDPCCQFSDSYIKDVCIPFAQKNNNSDCVVYYINRNVGNLGYTKKFLNDIGVVPEKYYYLRDNSPRYLDYGKNANADRYKNALNDIFDEDITPSMYVTPFAFVVSKTNQLKKAYIPYDENNIDDDAVYYGNIPQNIASLKVDKLSEINFNEVDTLIDYIN